MEPKENDIEDLNTDLEDHAIDSVSYGIPYIKWTDTTLGTIARPGQRKKLPIYESVVDLSTFE